MTVALFRAFPDAFRRSMTLYADELARGLRARLAGDGRVDEIELPAPRLAPPWARYWDQYVRYQRLAGRCRADVFHILDHAYGHLVRNLPEERTVVTFHDAVVTTLKGIGWRTRFSQRYSLSGIVRAARVIADSHDARRDFLALARYPPERVHVVHPGVGPSFRPLEDRQAVRRELGFARPVVLHVGHTLPYMNVARVISAFARLVRDLGIDAQLVKVGALSPALRAHVARLGLDDRVVELGAVPAATLPRVYGAADVLVYAPLHAGFGLPPLEAMACGTPVVCSTAGALPEVVGDAALMADPEDEAALAEATARLLTDGALVEDFRVRGQQRAARYTWETASRELLDIYRDVASA